jgi:ABC-2 type transport system permease protein
MGGMLSGFIENMPRAIQPFTYLIPLRDFLVILQSIFLKGVGLEASWHETLALAACGVVLLTVADVRSSTRSA